jgi:aromatic ring-cleaving dioxygenase
MKLIQVKMFRKIIYYPKNQLQITKSLPERNVEFFNVKLGGIYKDKWP